ncbi:hypothetical protein CAL26_19655 [Bordetella genomosp. 9]|uniref:ChrR-like cupin domain-containing protein n=1 Tax=Bordetella genomosp. 9 TaxID=1416803 RepID=A0A261R435_9BORD|nr:ChrR family anti-sigma-E factor [Bordetella genomosp. 9]OZI19788.1 hypothetical protein CAL26_19655 [Bordetella genomosp. 9]
MKPQHHLDDATLVSYSAGALPEALSVAAGAHLEMCLHCRARLRQADAVGGALLEARAGETGRDDATPLPKPGAQARAAMLQRLDADGSGMPAAIGQVADAQIAAAQVADVEHPPRPPVQGDEDCLPAALRPYFGTRYSGLQWRFLAPGVRMAKARVSQGRLFLLMLSPGVRMPEHGHGSAELSLVLRGAYEDRFGIFRAGDIADLDCDVEHQPIVADEGICITLGATDAPIRFKSWGLRLLQPWFGM